MEDKKLNLAEVLKGHVGRTFYSPMYGDVVVDGVYTEGRESCISIRRPSCKHYSAVLDENGRYDDGGELMIFPSKDQRDWDKWIEENTKVTYGDVLRELCPLSERVILPTFNGKQLEKLIAINKLMNAQKYIEKGWHPNWKDERQRKYNLYIDRDEKIKINSVTTVRFMELYFSSEANARRAIEILGGDVIKQALNTDW